MEISKNSKIKLITMFFGHPLVSFSKRELVTNYFLFNKKKKEKEVYTIRNKDSEGYFITESSVLTLSPNLMVCLWIFSCSRISSISAFSTKEERCLNIEDSHWEAL